MQAAEFQDKIKQMNQMQDQMQLTNMQQSASAGGQPAGNVTNVTATGGSNSAGGAANNANKGTGTGQQQAPLVSQLLQLNSNSFGGNMFSNLSSLIWNENHSFLQFSQKSCRRVACLSYDIISTCAGNSWPWRFEADLATFGAIWMAPESVILQECLCQHQSVRLKSLTHHSMRQGQSCLD